MYKLYPLKSNGEIRKSPEKHNNIESLVIAYQQRGGKIVIGSKEIQLTELKQYIDSYNEISRSAAQEHVNNAFAILNSAVSKLSTDDQDMFWKLYGKLRIDLNTDYIQTSYRYPEYCQISLAPIRQNYKILSLEGGIKLYCATPTLTNKS